ESPVSIYDQERTPPLLNTNFPIDSYQFSDCRWLQYRPCCHRALISPGWVSSRPRGLTALVTVKAERWAFREGGKRCSFESSYQIRTSCELWVPACCLVTDKGRLSEYFM